MSPGDLRGRTASRRSPFRAKSSRSQIFLEAAPSPPARPPPSWDSELPGTGWQVPAARPLRDGAERLRAKVISSSALPPGRGWPVTCPQGTGGKAESVGRWDVAPETLLSAAGPHPCVFGKLF